MTVETGRSCSTVPLAPRSRRPAGTLRGQVSAPQRRSPAAVRSPGDLERSLPV